ncbi:hypothetical protein A3A66_00250 [Microgenomates group bacterium RIFCSPLOWO2_01_FULL_46_13]|nr:MAG: hypothetical protein A2783_03530 [Microgenomates group bacterium RIFCSPHIGHO2_01_FULL_45_11]OGV94448.1 MAG: hypothetical protein A3A66_00250 [Microgenomates group bacterium RIFCSPLOWO2_01_FULL_46_13]
MGATDGSFLPTLNPEQLKELSPLEILFAVAGEENALTELTRISGETEDNAALTELLMWKSILHFTRLHIEGINTALFPSLAQGTNKDIES